MAEKPLSPYLKHQRKNRKQNKKGNVKIFRQINGAL